MSTGKQPQRIRLQLSEQAERYARRDAPVEARRMAARGALPLPPVELVTVLFVLLHDPDVEVKSRARESLEGLPDAILQSVLSGRAHPAVLSYLARTFRDRAEPMETLALNPAADDATIAFLASLPHRRVVDVVANNQQRMLRHPEIVEALGANPLTGRALIDRILSFLGLERPAAEQVEDAEAEEEVPAPEALGDAEAEAALRAVLAEDGSEFDDALLDDREEEVDEAQRGNLYQQIQHMTVTQKIKLARMGNKEARGLLIRDHNKLVASAAIRSPRISDNEVVQYARMKNLKEEVLRIIASNRDWTRIYAVKHALATNPKCPLQTAVKLLNHLQDRDLRHVMRSKDVPAAVSTHARRLLTRRGKI